MNHRGEIGTSLNGTGSRESIGQSDSSQPIEIDGMSRGVNMGASGNGHDKRLAE